MKDFSYAVLNIMILLSSFISCRFLIKFSSAQNKLQFYFVHTAFNFITGCFSLNTQIYLPQIVNNILGVLFTFLFCRFLLKTGVVQAILAALLCEGIFSIYNIMAFALSGILLRETQIGENIILVLNSILILALSAGTLELLIRHYGKHGKWAGKYSILCTCPLAFIYFVTGIIVNIAYNPVTVSDNRMKYGTTTIQDVEILIATGISIISVYVILYFYKKVMMQIEIQNKMSALEAYTETQKQYINEAKQKYEKTKVFRHDMNNHMATLAGLIKSNETQKAAEYLRRFDKEVKELSFDVSTGNAVIDVLLKEKLGFAKEQGIKVLCDTQIPSDFIVDDFDLCIIFFNALDNAIKGCEYADNKLIDIVAKKNKDFFIIDIMNSFNAANYRKGSGIGLETVRFITEQYGGYLEISEDKEVFRVSIIFNLK